MSKEGDEMKVAGIIAVGVALVMLAVLLFNGCSDGPDLIGPRTPAAVTAEPGCAPPDAGPDCTCPDGGEVVVLPTCGVICGL